MEQVVLMICNRQLMMPSDSSGMRSKRCICLSSSTRCVRRSSSLLVPFRVSIEGIDVVLPDFISFKMSRMLLLLQMLLPLSGMAGR